MDKGVFCFFKKIKSINLPSMTLRFTSINESEPNVSNPQKYVLESDFWRFVKVTNKLSPLLYICILFLRVVFPNAALMMMWRSFEHGLWQKYLTFVFFQFQTFQSEHLIVTFCPTWPSMLRCFISTILRATGGNKGKHFCYCHIVYAHFF